MRNSRIQRVSDHSQNRIISCSVADISWKFVHCFLIYIAHRQKEKPWEKIQFCFQFLLKQTIPVRKRLLNAFWSDIFSHLRPIPLYLYWQIFENYAEISMEPSLIKVPFCFHFSKPSVDLFSQSGFSIYNLSVKQHVFSVCIILQA